MERQAAAAKVVVPSSGGIDFRCGPVEAVGFEARILSVSGAAAATVWYYNFGRGGLALHRQNAGEKPRAFSVRCVRN